jgi:hypothetical protein
VADGGRTYRLLLNSCKTKKRELDEAMNADSSDDDDDVPEEWVSSDFSHLVVDEGSSVP